MLDRVDDLELEDIPYHWSSLTKEQQESLLKQSPLVAPLTDSLIWMRKWTQTLDEKDQLQPYKPFPNYEYFDVLHRCFHEEDKLFVEKSRTVMATWWACAECFHYVETHQPATCIFWCPDQDRAEKCIEYCKVLYRRQHPDLRAMYPLPRKKKAVEDQAVFRLELGGRGWFEALPGKNPDKIRSEHPTKFNCLCFGVGALLLFGCASAPEVSGQTLKQVAKFDLPGPGGKRFDYLTIDEDDHYLLSAHLAADQTYVIDLGTNKVIATITDTPGAEGVEYVPELKKFYTSNARDNTISVVDLKQMKVVKKLKTERKPDGSTYAAPFHKLYVSDERGKAEAVVDVQKDEIIRTLHFDSETGMPQYDPVARKVYVNLQDQNLFAVIDPGTDEVVGRYPVGRCKGNHGMALDPEHHRAFLSCEGNELMAVFDLDKHVPIAFLEMPGGPDVIKFDPGLNRIYVACYSGAIAVFHQDDPDHYRKLEDFRVQHAVHTIAVDLKTHRLYTPEQEEDGKPVARMVIYDAVTNP